MFGLHFGRKNKEKRQKKIVAASLAAAMVLTGCSETAYALPEDAPELETAVFVNEKDKEDEYASIMYGGREYVCYGTASQTFDNRVQACVGYTGGNRNDRVCTIKGTEDYIMRTFMDGFINQPLIYRAADTLGKEIYTPGFIRSLDYELWTADGAEV